MEENEKLKAQEEEEEKEEKKKILPLFLWFKGLKTWAKVTLCCGIVAIAAAAITLPIVLTKKGGGNSVNMTFSLNNENKSWSKYISKENVYKEGKKLVYTLKIEQDYAINGFTLDTKFEGEQINGVYNFTDFKCYVNGVDNTANWTVSASNSGGTRAIATSYDFVNNDIIKFTCTLSTYSYAEYFNTYFACAALWS